MLSVQPPISIARYTGVTVSGTSASICAIHTATISSMDVRHSMPPIAVDMPGTELVDTATITAVAITSVTQQSTDVLM